MQLFRKTNILQNAAMICIIVSRHKRKNMDRLNFRSNVRSRPDLGIDALNNLPELTNVKPQLMNRAL